MPSTKKSEAKRLFISYIANTYYCLEIKKIVCCLYVSCLCVSTHSEGQNWKSLFKMCYKIQ